MIIPSYFDLYNLVLCWNSPKN